MPGLGFEGSLHPSEVRTERTGSQSGWWTGVKPMLEALWRISTWGRKSEEQKEALMFKLQGGAYN